VRVRVIDAADPPIELPPADLVIDAAYGRVTSVCAGHPPQLLFRLNGLTEPVGSPGDPLGMLANLLQAALQDSPPLHPAPRAGRSTGGF